MKKKIALLIAGLALSVSAFALAPALFWGLSIAQFVGGALYGSLITYANQKPDYVKAEARLNNGKPVKVTMITNTEASPSEIAKQEASVPATGLSPSLTPPYSITLANYDRSATYTATGSSYAELKNAIALCPSDICKGPPPTSGANVFSSSSGTTATTGGAAAANISVASDVTIKPTYLSSTTDKWFVEVAISYGSYVVRLHSKPSGLTCEPGYAYNATSAKCDLTDVDLASASTGDGVCVVFGGYPLPGDPDCQALAGENKLTTSTTGSGEPAVSVVSKDNVVVSQVSKGDQGSVISQVVPTSDGGTRREDTVVSPTGVIGPTNTTNYPSNPPPIYPGDKGGTAIPGSSGTGTTSAPCGGSGQPACKIDGMTELNGSAAAIARDVGMVRSDISKIANSKLKDDAIGEALPSDISDPLVELEESASVIPVSSYCPADIFSFTLPLPSYAGGSFELSDQGLFCDLMSDYQEVIRMISIACGFIAATFIVLRA